MKLVGEPDAGNPHVRFDERGRETERLPKAQATAPFLDSTPTMQRLECTVIGRIRVPHFSHRSTEQSWRPELAKNVMAVTSPAVDPSNE